MRFLNSTACSFVVMAMLATTVSAQSGIKPDNTAQNKGDLSKNAVTAEKQSNKKSQIKSLAAIRRRIERDRTLSTNAKNVKILFADGVVTLAGPVESDGEKTRVEAIVRSYNGTKSVINQLSVIPKTY